MSDGYLESNMGVGPGNESPVSLISYYGPPLNIYDEMAQTTTQNNLILLLSRNIFLSGEGEGVRCDRENISSDYAIFSVS